MDIAQARQYMWRFAGYPNPDILTALLRQKLTWEDEEVFRSALDKVIASDSDDECCAPDEIPWRDVFILAQKQHPWILSGFEGYENKELQKLLEDKREKN